MERESTFWCKMCQKMAPFHKARGTLFGDLFRTRTLDGILVAFWFPLGAILARKAMFLGLMFVFSRALSFHLFFTYCWYSFGLKVMFFALCAKSAHMHFEKNDVHDLSKFTSPPGASQGRKNEPNINANTCSPK